MEVNATKGSAAAEIIAATAKAKKAASASDGAASMFASAVSAATKGTAHSSGNNSGLGALGGMFSKGDTNPDAGRDVDRDVGNDDMGDSGRGRDADLHQDDAPVARQADAPVRDDRPTYDDAPKDAPVVEVEQQSSEPQHNARTERPEQQADTAPTDDGAPQQSSQGDGQKADTAAQTGEAVPGGDATAAISAVLAHNANDPAKNTQATAGAVEKTAVKATATDTQAATKQAAPVVQAQAAQTGAETDTSKKQVTTAAAKGDEQAVSKKSGEDVALPQDVAKAKPTAKTAQAQTTQQTASHAKSGGEASAQQAQNQAQTQSQGQSQTQSQAQAQAQDLSRRLGGDQRVDVAVTVEKESDTLTSRPNVSLAASATKSAAAASGRGADAGQNGQNMGGNAQNQAQAQAAMQAQANTAQAASRPAGATGFQAQMNVAATTQAGGAEGASAANATASAGATPGSNTQQANASLPQQAAKAPHSPHTQRAVTEQVSVQIAKAAGNGSDKISIRLNPASLGRIDVQLELGQDGRMTATIIADNKDTFEMLQKDARGLAKALQDAGLNTNSGDLNFSMRGDNAAEQDQQGRGASGSAAKPDMGLIEQPLDELLAGSANRNVITNDRVDIQV